MRIENIGHGLAVTPFGDALLAWTGRGLCHLAFRCTDEAALLAELRQLWPTAALGCDDAHARSLAIFEQAGIDQNHLEYRRARKWQALAMIQAGQAAEARERLLPLKERARTLDGEDSVEHADVTWQLLRAAVAMEDVARGEPLLAEVRERSAKFVPPTHQVFIEFLRHEATFTTLRGDLEGAERLRRDALAREIANNNLTGPSVARAELAVLLARHGKRAEAAALLREALPVLRKHLLPQHVNRIRFENLARQLGV